MKYIFIILALFATQLQAQRSDCNGPKITLPKFSDTDAIKNGVLYLTTRNEQCSYLYCPSEQCVRVKRYRSNYCNFHAMKRIVQTKVIYSQTCGCLNQTTSIMSTPKNPMRPIYQRANGWKTQSSTTKGPLLISTVILYN